MKISTNIGIIDHYTLIVPDANSSKIFHEQVLGFIFIKTQYLDSGTGLNGEPDMINHILRLPNEPSKCVVITQGLTENSIFNIYMRENGSGLHHIAYRVNNLEKRFLQMKKAGIKFTSSDILEDPISRLKQIFIDKIHGGYFIELIERNDNIIDNEFTNKNMKKLACTMNKFISN